MKMTLLISIILCWNLGMSDLMAHPTSLFEMNALDTLPPDSLVNGLPAEIDAFINEEVTFKIPIITCQQLHQIQENGREELAIMDARSQREFNVSHLENARRVGYEDFSTEKVWFYDKTTIVVIYCKEGQKSEKIALKLKEMGFLDIRNLYGSIIEWVNQGLPVVDKAGKPTKKIFIPKRKMK